MSEDKKISELTAVTSNASGDIFPLVQGGVNKRSTLAQMQAYMQDYLTLGVTQSGVYLVKVNGNIIRYDDTSDTPIQDAINAAEVGVVGKDSVLLVNYECGPANLGFNGKMEQNIVLRDDVNMYALGGTKLFSNSTDDTPMFTDNGVQAQVFFIGYWNMVRYGGAGANNRCAVKLTHASSEVYFPDFIVADTSSGSTNSFDIGGSINIGNGFWTGAMKISGGTNIVNVDPHYAPNLTVSSGTVYWNGRAATISQSGGVIRMVGVGTTTAISSGTIYCAGSLGAITNTGGVVYTNGCTSLNNSNGTANIYDSSLTSATISGGTANINNSTFPSGIVISGGTANLTSCTIGENGNSIPEQISVTGGVLRVDSCLIIGSDIGILEGATGLSCSDGTAIVSYCTIVMTDNSEGGVTSLAQSSTGVIKNYFSISNTATSGSITVAALTVNANVQ